MLNCGGLVDLSEYFTLSDEMTCYVLDSHRPLNLHNIYATNQIVVLDDGDIESTSDIKEAFEALEVRRLCTLFPRQITKTDLNFAVF